MAQDKEKTTVFTLGPIPLILLAAFGLGSLHLTVEDFFLPTVQPFSISENTDFMTLIILLLMIGLFIWRRKNLENLKGQTILCLAVGLLFTLSLIILFGHVAWISSITAYSIVKGLKLLSETLLMFFWIRTLVRLGVRQVALFFAFSFITFALFNALTLLITPIIGLGIIPALPLVSAICLCFFVRYQKMHTVEMPAEQDKSPVREQRVNSLSWTTFTITIIVPILCFSLVFGTIHSQWMQFQDEPILTMITQLGAVCGSALSGIFILVFVRFFWNWDNVELFKAFLLPIVIIALWLSSFISPDWMFICLMLLSASQKFVILFIMMAPFMFEKTETRLIPWCFAYLALIIGRALNSLLLTGIFSSVNLIITLIILGMLFVSSILPTMLSNTQRHNSIIDAETDDIQDQQFKREEKIVMKLHKAVHVLAERHMLTKREEEVLVLLARGRTSTHVAESLVISPLTAKTHQKNIYAKMQVHSQQELISLIEEAIDEQRAPR